MKISATRLSAIAALACFAAGPALAAGTDGSCSNATMQGLYIFSANGYQVVDGAAQPKAIVEMIRFNGDGTLVVPGVTRSVNGVVTRAPAHGLGTYALDADCIGTLTFTNGPAFDIFAAPRGDDMWMIQTNSGNVLQGNVTRVYAGPANCQGAGSEISRFVSPGCQ